MVKGAGNGRILLVRLRSLGDVVLMTPLLTVAKRGSPCEVGVVVEQPFDEMLRHHPEVDRVFVLKRGPGKLISRLQVLREIQSFGPDTAIDLHGGSTSCFITTLSGAKTRVGYAQNLHGRFYNVKVPDSSRLWGKEHVHTVEHQLSPLKYLGFPVEPVPPLKVPIDEMDIHFIRIQLERRAIREHFVLIHPGAAFDTKQWESEKFVSLAERLVKMSLSVVITAGPDGGTLLENIRSLSPPEVHFINPLSLGKFSALTSLCSLYVGNDTGTTHIAAALGKKIVVIWGSSDFKAWHPWGVKHALLKSELSCIPCPGYYCLHYPEPRCIRSIRVEPVLEAVKALL